MRDIFKQCVIAIIDLVNRSHSGTIKKGSTIMIQPTIVCLCGSTRFNTAFQDANLQETIAGRIVLSIGCDMKSNHALFNAMTDADRTRLKARLDILHLQKIDLADEILVLNVGGYIGESTAREILYARSCGKRVRFLEDQPEWM